MMMNDESCCVGLFISLARLNKANNAKSIDLYPFHRVGDCNGGIYIGGLALPAKLKHREENLQFVKFTQNTVISVVTFPPNYNLVPVPHRSGV